MKKFIILLNLLALATLSWAQDDATVVINAANNGTTNGMQETAGGTLLNIRTDNVSTSSYNDGPYDYYVVIEGTCEDPDLALGIYFEVFDIAENDTLFIYDGPSTSSYCRWKANNVINNLYHATLFPSPDNTSGKLTLRFKTNGDGITGAGFVAVAKCRPQCEDIVPIIDSVYYKTRNGVITDTSYTRMVQVVDTNWNNDSTDFTLDTQYFRGVHLCWGEGVIFSGHGEYTNMYGYHPEDGWSVFEWTLGNGKDTSGVGLTKAPAYYSDIDCYDVSLRIEDIRGCRSTLLESVRVRIAANPIKTIYDLTTMCTTDSSIVNIGYEGANATITMQYINFDKPRSRQLECRTFVPDGKNQNCEGSVEDCFFATITFDDFPAGRTVTSTKDICSICINMEHEFLGDFRLSIQCPNNKRAVLKYADYGHESGLPDSVVDGHNNPNGPFGYLSGGIGGSGTALGIPYGGSGHHGFDGKCTNNENNYCDSICNMYGVGKDYCFSRNGDYTLVSGKKADTQNPVKEELIACTSGNVNLTSENDFVFQTIPPPYYGAGTASNPQNVTYRTPSNHEEKLDYYLPVTDLRDLIGCPLNGDWSIMVCDWWGSDNGWVFSWSLDFCGISSGIGCEYQVGIDSVIWTPDSAYGDFDLGRWRGLEINNAQPKRSIISSHDTAGYFPINVSIYDNFGCRWDTTTGIQTVWAPTPVIGDTLLICDVEQVILDASDRHKDSLTTYKWEPFGQTTDTIMTRSMMGSSTLYTVEVENHWRSTTCRTRDSVRVNINRQPLPNFDPGVYPLEGCEPYTIHFENTSQYSDSYVWVFGDGDTSFAKSPTHTYGTGQYSFKYFTSNKEGCNDSLVYSDLITVYPSPVARFSWEPMNPTVMHPSVTFQNLTIPQSDDNRYYWEIQYDRDNNISYHTLRDVNPTFEWETDGEDISGNYIARLIALTQNLGPSGLVIECRDTAESSILLVNDFLQFPNAVTPNGDGVNDKFIIRNLINGLGYPNNSLAIYDRWGKRVFYKENIATEDDFWDPAADNIPAGTYFWRFSGKGYLGDIQRNGVVEVIY